MSALTKPTSQDWIAVTVLPNIDLGSAIDGGPVAIAPQDDARVVTLCNAHPQLKEFLGRFTDAFSTKLRPAVLLVSKDAAPKVLDMEALAGFRDAIALSVIPQGRALALTHANIRRINFANAFWLYPWILNRAYSDLVAATPGLLGIHDIRECSGQATPELTPAKLMSSDIDKPLLEALLKRWTQRYMKKGPKRKDVALFRSLNMAMHASLLPGGSEATFYDLGRMIALWISAFEILVHPGKGKASLPAVYRLLDTLRYENKQAGYKRYVLHGQNPKKRSTLACWLYGELYKARNDFLHGNPVNVERLTVKRSKRNLFQYTAPLYRLALTAFLPLRWDEPCPPMDDTARLGKHIAEHMTFTGFQEAIEEAILTARQ
jgi:hypothetical protein